MRYGNDTAVAQPPRSGSDGSTWDKEAMGIAGKLRGTFLPARRSDGCQLTTTRNTVTNDIRRDSIYDRTRGVNTALVGEQS